MNARHRLITKLAAVLTFLCATGWTARLEAQMPAVAEVRGLLGRAKFAPAGGAMAELKGGAMLHAGDVIQTATGSAVDLYLGAGAGTVRLTEGSIVAIEKLGETNGVLDIELSLREGELLGKDVKVAPGSKLVVRNSAGFGAVLGGHFRFDARGHVVLLEGKIIFVQIEAAAGEPAASHLSAPPAVYWSPVEGIKMAPSALVREVKNQTRSKLPKG